MFRLSRSALNRALLSGMLLLPMTGCGIALSTAALMDARSAWQEADQLNARQRAPYEYTLGTEYLRKAREEAASSDYQTAEALARQATAYLEKAQLKAGNNQAADEDDSLEQEE